MKQFILILLLAGIIYSCQQGSNDRLITETISLHDASWIGSPEPYATIDSLRYQENHPVLVRKEFDLDQGIKSAHLAISAAGYYTVWINGVNPADYMLDPAWTNYAKRIYYRTLDVTDLIQKGKNVIAIEVAGGWYDPLPLMMWGGRNIRNDMPVGKPRVVASLKLTMANGELSTLTTDESWHCSIGEIMHTNVYLGEIIDQNRDKEGWTGIGYDDSGWSKAEVLPSPGGKLVQAFFPPIRKTYSYKPQKIWSNEDGKWIIDFGTNMAGIVEYSGPAIPGKTISIRYGERIYPDSSLNVMTAVAGQIKRKGVGGPGSPDIAEQCDAINPVGNLTDFQPRYTYHGFRYIEVEGLPTRPDPESFTAWRMGTDVYRQGDFYADAQWLNQIQEIVEQSFLTNIFSVQSDCPAREKFGYGGDLNATAEAYLYNFNMKDFYVKTLYDWLDAMKEDGFVDTAPFVGIAYCGLSWESAYLLLQYQLYKFYRDTTLVNSFYNENLKWLEKVRTIHPDGWVRQGLSDHESLKPVPVELTGTTHYFGVLEAMETFARVNGDDQMAQKLNIEKNGLRQLILDSLWYHPVKDIENPQTWYSALLYYDLLPDDQVSKAIDLLVDAVKMNDGALTTGIFGTVYLLEALSRNGHAQLAFDIVSRNEFPGWRHMLNQGATTVWETWKESENIFSQNHPMFGSVTAWFYRWLGGIQMEAGGEQRVHLHPAPLMGLNHVETQVNLPEGIIRVNWNKKGDQIIFDVDKPDKISALWAPEIPQGYSLSRIKAPGADPATSGSKLILEKGGHYRLTYEMQADSHPEKTQKASRDLLIFHAGSLSVPMKRMAEAFENEHPDVRVLLESAGSLTCVRKITELQRNCDIIALADWELIDRFLIPEYVSTNTLFATNAMVIAWLKDAKGVEVINENNWYQVLGNPKVRYGRSDPDSDPCGYRTIMTLKLADRYYQDGVNWEVLLKKDNAFVRPKEADLNALLESKNLDYIFTYRSIAVQQGFAFLNLPKEIDLRDPALNELYASVEVSIAGETPGSSVQKQGGVMYYGISRLKQAPNPKVAGEFLNFVLDPDKGLRIIEETGQKIIEPHISPNSR